jgi:hypothetical protein
MFMHFSGRGDPVRLAEALRAAIALTGTEVPPPMLGQPPLGLDTAQLDAIIGHKGFADSGVYKFHIPRAEPFMVDGMRVPPTVGAETMIHFQPTGPGQAAVTGDFAMTPLEVNNVIRALRTNGIQVATVHNHMLTEEPHLIFLHFVANNDALRLAQGLRAALDQTNAARDPTAPPPLPLDAAIAR